jgi:RNA polymerase sigma-70 factor (ECF subfamily)
MATLRIGTIGSPNTELGLSLARPHSGALETLELQVVELYDTVRLPVFRYLVCMGLTAGEADDIVQETFLRVYQHVLKCREDSNLRAWVFRVAHNLAVNQHKRQQLFAEIVQAEARSVAGMADPSPSAEEMLLQRERWQRVGRALRSLSPQEMQCLQLRAEGFRYREIANIVGIGVSTVADSLRRVLAKLTGEKDA